ncbi:MAG: hypothetical protein IH978_07250 [Nitrospinae bacterium]|nr:hypothetical protein [Nitrospinota bacterium]
MKDIFFAVLLIIPFSMDVSFGATCQQWGPGTPIGRLDTSKISEASGLSASQRFPNRLYHINDSGGGAYFYLTDLYGNNTQSVRIAGFPNSDADFEDGYYPDFEDIGVGPCDTHSHCLFIGDIGDNSKFDESPTRKNIVILIIEEEKKFSKVVVPKHRITVVYPDGPHNAEGLAVHPNGNLFIVTKEYDLLRWESSSAKLFKLHRTQWEKNQNQVQSLTFVGEIDVPALMGPDSDLWDGMVTAFDIASDGNSFLLLTYGGAIEFFIDLSTPDLSLPQKFMEGRDYRLLDLKVLPQQEGIGYLPGSRSFIYGTELGSRLFRLLRGHRAFDRKATLIRVDCLK